MQSRLSTHSPDGSVEDVEEPDPDVWELPELVLELVPLPDPVVVPDVPVVVVVELSVDVDEGVCTVVPADVPVEPASADVDVESVDPERDCDCEAVVAVGVGAVTESVWTDEPFAVDTASVVRRCLPVVVAGVSVVDRCVPAVVEAGRTSSEVGSSDPPMARLSGEVAAWVRVLAPWCIAETVRPPPTRATAVATTALRWFFFQRARWRRRAARPSVTTGASATSSDGRPVSAAGSSWRPASCQVGASSQDVAAVPVVA